VIPSARQSAAARSGVTARPSPDEHHDIGFQPDDPAHSVEQQAARDGAGHGGERPGAERE
jgi:hypothetical protein